MISQCFLIQLTLCKCWRSQIKKLILHNLMHYDTQSRPIAREKCEGVIIVVTDLRFQNAYNE